MRRPDSLRYARQRGVALITVLLVFAVVAVIAAEMLRRSQLTLRSVDNLIEARQAWYYALGGEALARQILALDARSNRGDRDSLDEPWALAGEQPPFEIEGGAIKLEIRDLQGRFNLNSLVDADGNAFEPALPRLKQLFAGLGVDARLAGQWRDWVDRDQNAQPDGGEDAAYPRYRTAAGPEADVSALRLLRDMQPEQFERTEPHVAVLPADALLNINTADGAVLRALTPIISAHASQILARQREGGFADLAALEAVIGPGADLSGLSVSSGYFEAITTVQYGDRLLRLRSVLRRDQNSGAITVLSRSRTPIAATNATSTGNQDR
jgi:general secretion pathway protein K